MSTPGPLHLLDATDPDADAVSLAVAVLEALIAHPADAQAVGEVVATAFRGSPPLLAVGRAASEGIEAVRDLRQGAGDEDWIESLARRLGRFPSVGILSMGAGTTAVLSTAASLGRLPAQGFVASRAVARALAFLDMALRTHPPEEATALLVPTLGSVGFTVFVAERHAGHVEAAMRNGATVLAVVHPLARMDVDLAGRFEPPTDVVAVRL